MVDYLFLSFGGGSLAFGFRALADRKISGKAASATDRTSSRLLDSKDLGITTNDISLAPYRNSRFPQPFRFQLVNYRPRGATASVALRSNDNVRVQSHDFPGNLPALLNRVADI
jgi:hypothetical protein